MMLPLTYAEALHRLENGLDSTFPTKIDDRFLFLKVLLTASVFSVKLQTYYIRLQICTTLTTNMECYGRIQQLELTGR